MPQRALSVLTVIAAVLGFIGAIIGFIGQAWGVATLCLAVVVAALVIRTVSGSRFNRRVR